MRSWSYARTLAQARALLLPLICAMTFTPAMAQSERSHERGVKAAFLFKFAGYIEWPASDALPGDTLIAIAIAHDPALAEELERIVLDRRINNHTITVKRLKDGESPAGAHLLFIGATDRARTTSLIRAAQLQPMLVVTELDHGLMLGSGINFVMIDGRVRFEASAETVEKSGLKLSSRLLSVALGGALGGASNVRAGNTP